MDPIALLLYEPVYPNREWLLAADQVYPCLVWVSDDISKSCFPMPKVSMCRMSAYKVSDIVTVNGCSVFTVHEICNALENVHHTWGQCGVHQGPWTHPWDQVKIWDPLPTKMIKACVILCQLKAGLHG